MRELGEGIPRMFSVMEQEGFYPPRFEESSGTYFQVTLRNQPVYDSGTLDWLRQFAAYDLTAEQKRLLAFARSHGMRFTNRDLQKLAGMDLYSASNSIKTLIRKGVARSLAKGSRIYEVVEPGTDSIPLPPPLLDLLPVLLEKGEISNEDIRRALVVTRSVATGLVTDLWEAGWLTRSGQGRWTRYRLSESAQQQFRLAGTHLR
jgi:DNA-binding MarR family transcriptional regulator